MHTASDARGLWDGDLHGCAGWAGPAVGGDVGGAVAEGSRYRRIVIGGGRGAGAGDSYPAAGGLILALDNEAEPGGRRLELQRDMRIGSGGVLRGGCGRRGHLRRADADRDGGRGVAAVAVLVDRDQAVPVAFARAGVEVGELARGGRERIADDDPEVAVAAGAQDRNCAVFSAGSAGTKLSWALPSAPLALVIEGASGTVLSARVTGTVLLGGPSALSKATATTRYSRFTLDARPMGSS